METGEWLIKEEKKKIKGHLDIPEFSFGELDDLQVQIATIICKPHYPEGRELFGCLC